MPLPFMPRASQVKMQWGDKVIDLEKPIRIRQASRGGNLPGTVVEGVIVGAPTSSTKAHEPMMIRFHFFGDVKVDFVPLYGDELEQAE